MLKDCISDLDGSFFYEYPHSNINFINWYKSLSVFLMRFIVTKEIVYRKRRDIMSDNYGITIKSIRETVIVKDTVFVDFMRFCLSSVFVAHLFFSVLWCEWWMIIRCLLASVIPIFCYSVWSSRLFLLFFLLSILLVSGYIHQVSAMQTRRMPCNHLGFPHNATHLASKGIGW